MDLSIPQNALMRSLQFIVHKYSLKMFIETVPFTLLIKTGCSIIAATCFLIIILQDI